MVLKMKIRALTIFIDLESYEDTFDEIVRNFSMLTDQVSKELGIEVWTKRLAIGRMEINDASKITKKLENIHIQNYVNYIAIPIWYYLYF